MVNIIDYINDTCYNINITYYLSGKTSILLKNSNCS